MALASPHVRSASIEAQEFYELAVAYNVRSVPKIVVNDRLEFTGALPEPAFVDAVLSAVTGPDGSGAATV
jgi:predicted DsbA family dithiol-disulfide isomerase